MYTIHSAHVGIDTIIDTLRELAVPMFVSFTSTWESPLIRSFLAFSAAVALRSFSVSLGMRWTKFAPTRPLRDAQSGDCWAEPKVYIEFTIANVLDCNGIVSRDMQSQNPQGLQIRVKTLRFNPFRMLIDTVSRRDFQKCGPVEVEIRWNSLEFTR